MEEIALSDFYRNKKVLITGNTGFKGSWLTQVLLSFGAKVFGYSDTIYQSPSLYQCLDLGKQINQVIGDIRDLDSLATAINSLKPNLVFHLAAQPLVRESYLNPLRTFEVNAGGTINILEAIRNYSDPLTAVLITSDKVYRNIEMINGYREDDLIGGKDPYSGSKGMAELAIYSYFQSYFQKAAKEKRIVIARAGNVVGGGDWAQDRLIPDVIRAIEASGKVMLRKPSATRPWQHVLEPVVGYLKLGMCAKNNESINGMAFNFGPLISETGSVYDFCENFLMALDLDPKKYLEIDLVPTMEAPEANLLALNCDKAYGLMGWSSKLTRNSVIDMTACWYKAYMNKGNLVKLTNAQINSYLTHG